MLDSIDLQILSTLQKSARTSNAEIARNLGMAPSAILERIRKLESKGVIEGYNAKLNPDLLGKKLLAFVFLQVDDRVGDQGMAAKLSSFQEVQEVHDVTGEDRYLLKVRVEDTHALWRLIREKIGALASVRQSRTTIVLKTEKESSGLALE